MSLRVPFLARALVVGSMLMTLACGGGAGAPPPTPEPDAGPPAPPEGKVAHFLPVQVLSIHPGSLVRAVAKPRSATGVVIMRDEKAGMNGELLFRPEAWFDLDDGTMVHMTTDGTGRDPSVTRFERMGESIRLELVNGSARAVYTDVSGKQTSFTDAGGAAMQPLMDESPESAVDRTLKWFMSCRHHPSVDKAWQTVEKLNMWAQSLQTGFEDAQQALEQAHKVFVKDPIAPDLTEPPSEYQVTLLLRELNTKALAKPSVDNDLPAQPYVRDETTQELVPAPSYAPPRVPCVREYKRDGVMAMIRSTCAATTEDCQMAKGQAFERRADCEGWCARQAEPKAVLASFDPAKHELACYQQQCNDELDDLSFRPKLNEEACALGCAPELCSGETGACEVPTMNAQGQSYVYCKEGLTKGFCEAGPTAEAFVPGKKCSDVGYPYWNAGEGVWRMTPPTTYDAGPKLDGPKADAGAGTDAPRADAGAGTDAPRTDGGTTTPTKVCSGGRFEILEVGTPKPATFCDRYSTECNGSGRVYDSVTRLTWSRNELRAVFRSDFTEAASACSKIGMRLPTMSELKAVAPVICKEAVHWAAVPFMTSTDHPDPDPAWHYCVTYPTGVADYCVNYVGLVCVK